MNIKLPWSSKTAPAANVAPTSAYGSIASHPTSYSTSQLNAGQVVQLAAQSGPVRVIPQSFQTSPYPSTNLQLQPTDGGSYGGGSSYWPDDSEDDPFDTSYDYEIENEDSEDTSVDLDAAQASLMGIGRARQPTLTRKRWNLKAWYRAGVEA